MRLCLLDTNIASCIIKGDEAARRRLVEVPMESVAISAVTEGELRFGAARLSDAARVRTIMEAFLIRVTIHPWDSGAARHYGVLRAALERDGVALSNPDTMIAAHALALGATLVTHDKAFTRIPGLAVEDWTRP